MLKVCLSVQANQIWLPRNLLLEGFLTSGFRPIGYFDQLLTPGWWMMTTIAYDGGTSIDQWMLGIGEVWYFSSKTNVFRQTNDIFMMDVEHQCIY